MTQNTCYLQLVGKFKKLKKKLEIRYPLSLLFSYNFYIISSLRLWMETLISDPCLREFLLPSTSHAASLLQKVCGFKNIKPQTYTPSEIWDVIERGRERSVLLLRSWYVAAPLLGYPEGLFSFHAVPMLLFTNVTLKILSLVRSGAKLLLISESQGFTQYLYVFFLLCVVIYVCVFRIDN